MSDWTELPDYPRTFPSQCAPWSSSVRLVNGVKSVKNGKPETLSGARAFLQDLEIALVRGRAATPDLPELLDKVLSSHARHIDVVEDRWVQGRRIWNQHTYNITNSIRVS